MESKKLNWNKILNSLIGIVGLVLATLFIGLCFVLPMANIKANSKNSIKNEHNIHFVSAKTNIKRAIGYDKYSYNNTNNMPAFDGYQYNYAPFDPNNPNEPETYENFLYYSSLADSTYGSETNGRIDLTSTINGNTSHLMQYQPYQNNYYELTGYIPNGVTHFKNANGLMEEVFYDEFDEGDFVMLNNYNAFNNRNNDSSFNVENIYLSFGSPYVDELTHTTPLHDLIVEAKLYAKDSVHYLLINGTEKKIIQDGKEASYWHQYLDLRNLQAKASADLDAQTYYIPNQEGRYEFTFRFIKYDSNLNPVSQQAESFTYSFYVIDSANYSDYPTISNAQLGVLESNTISEHFFNFTTDNSTITYDPSRYNVSYIRENRDINEKITSTFSTGTYQLDGVNYPKGVISYRNQSNQLVKEMIILVYHNKSNNNDFYGDRSLVEYLYLSNTTGNSLATTSTYSIFETLLDNNTLKFEYKLTSMLDTFEIVLDTYYRTTTFKTYSYDNYQFNVSEGDTYYDDNDDKTIETIIKSGNSYYTNTTDESNKIASLETISTGNYINEVTTVGIILNKFDLTETTLDANSIKYELNGDILKRTYLNPADSAEISTNFILNTDEAGDFEFVDEVFGHITIHYSVNSSNVVQSVAFTINNFVQLSTISTNARLDILNRLLTPNQIPIDYSYILTFKELGIYQFNYSYVCPITNSHVTNVTPTSTNLTTPKDYAVQFDKLEPLEETIVSNQQLEVTVSGYLIVESGYTVTLNGITYTYNKQASTLTTNSGGVINLINNKSIGQQFTFVNGANNQIVDCTYIITETTEGIKLSITYIIGTFSQKQLTTSYSSTKLGKNYYVKKEIITYNTYDLQLRSEHLSIVDANLSGLRALLVNLEDYYTSDTNEYVSTTKVYSETSPIFGKEKLHIYGSIAYFNKKDNSTDSTFAKLEKVDVKQQMNYISDVTSTYLKVNSGENAKLTATKDFRGFSQTIIGNNTHQIAYENIIVTDVNPVLWNNFSTLLYNSTNLKVSESYIYKYNNYSRNSDGTINLGDYEYSKYTKDTYCQFDGLYEIVVFYTYDHYKQIGTGGQIFYQLFTFIIDNSSPKFTIEVQDENSGDYSPLALTRYTNKNVRISWDVPTYFKNNVYIDILKEYYTNTSTTFNFNAVYNKGDITLASGNGSYVNAISEMSTSSDNMKYYVTLRLPEMNPNGYTLDGNYKITLHYGPNGMSSISEKFIFDKQDISGLQLFPVMQNTNGGYSINNDITFGNNQIINSDFTFRYNSKLSGAKIYTYWHKVDFLTFGDYDKIVIASDNGQGITTTFKVHGTGDDIATGKLYNYNYETSNSVNNGNYFTSSNSCIYLFRMRDEAGNECRYIVFYDQTAPRFLVSPKPNNANNIINDTTKVTWGDYKAIKIDTPIDFNLHPTAINNYTKLTYIDRLKESLSYINSSNNFNNAKIEKIGDSYYILIPVDKIQIDDENGQTINVGTAAKDYYFFPNNPITEGGSITTISLPKFAADGTPVYNGSVVEKESFNVQSYSIQTITNNYGVTIERYITATYVRDGVNVLLNGAIGSGLYIYSVFDKLGNNTSGDLWMNLDKTQTMAYGLFDYSENMSNIVGLTGESSKSYSMSRLYMSSLEPSEEDSIPDYEVTYKYFGYNSSLYSDYNIVSVTLLTSADDSNLIGQETCLKLELDHKTDPTLNKSNIRVMLTDEDGNIYPAHSYPYDLQGTAVVADASNNPKDIYIDNTSPYKNSLEPNRKYTLPINRTTDSSIGKIVTQEGLYIFKREYTDYGLDLGNDTRIIYRVYYVDRNGIINVTTSNSISDNLYNIGEDIEFTLGSTYDIDNYKKTIDHETIRNNQTALNSHLSNAEFASNKLFATNKIQVEFAMTTDKYNFYEFDLEFKNQFMSKIPTGADSSEYKTLLERSIFNQNEFNQKYKLDLLLKKGMGNNQVIIDETNNDKSKIFNQSLMNKYLKDNWDLGSGQRNNNFHLFYGDNNNSYTIGLSDQAGYIKRNADGTINNRNYQANSLNITFDIVHTPPTGETYGKYYGRYDYDENKNNASTSIPIDQDGTYQLISKYLADGQLQPLSDNYYPRTSDENGSYIKLYSTNNETLIFLFTITNDEYLAKIDTGNIQIYKGLVGQNNLIFNRVNGVNVATPLVSVERQIKSYITNVIDGVTYHAIIIFDNNLDEILDADEQSYSSHRLLDSINNSDSENYFIKINYVGNKDDYKGEDNNKNVISYYSTTYSVVVDRIKPTYNLAKLVDQDKYVYNNVNTTLNKTNYQSVFNSYKPFYNFSTDAQYDFERSDLENYFFAVDYRPDTSFVFESISELDNINGIFVRPVDPHNYKFAITPDDYKAYYTAIYMQGHPQFTPSNAISVYTTDLDNSNFKLNMNEFYHISYSLTGMLNTNSISMNYLVSKGLLKLNSYYEIIETDEAGNYRVYGIYLPSPAVNMLSYTYQLNNNADTLQHKTIAYESTPVVSASGMNLKFVTYTTRDYFIKSVITVASAKLNQSINIFYNPNTLALYVTDSTNNILEVISNVSKNDYNTKFIETINNRINNYNALISNKDSQYYTQYGYTINISIIDRIGIPLLSTTKLYNYEIAYTVAGSVLIPTFKDESTAFTMSVPAKTGSTYITKIRAYKFNKVWTPMDVDSRANSFFKTESELSKGFVYTLTKGVYKFELTDNFNRTSTYFHEFGISGSQTGGSLRFTGNYIKYSDDFLYTSKYVQYTYDSSVYDIYIKFIGDAHDLIDADEYEYLDEIIYSSTTTYTEELARFGISSIITSGNITTITFNGVRDLTKYHIKTILASTSSNYQWGDEATNKDVIVYNNKLAVYASIPSVIIKNLNGNTLDTSTHLNLTEDFELVIAWPTSTSTRISFGSEIILTRKYVENGVVKSTTSKVPSGYVIMLPGEYTAYVTNSLSNVSRTITFTRGEGEISMYAVFTADVLSNVEQKLIPSTYVSTESSDSKTIFHYYTTDKFFNYIDFTQNVVITRNNLANYINSTELMDIIAVNKTTSMYIDVRVNSNLSIFSDIFKIGIDGDFVTGTPFVQYRIYSKSSSSNDPYIFRYIQVHFLNGSETSLTNTYVSNSGMIDSNLYSSESRNSVIKTTSNGVVIKFDFTDGDGLPLSIIGNTMFVDRYYNSTLVETIELNMSDNHNIPNALFNLNTVGLHHFVIRDLAGRTHRFGNSGSSTNPNILYVYLINQILYTINDSTPINNQIFNKEVKVNVISTLSGLTLYNTRSLGVSVIRNGVEITVANDNGELKFTEPGYYTVTMTATTSLSDGNNNFPDQEITSSFNFVIVRNDVALRSFNVSKGTGFVIEKIIKILNGERYDITSTYSDPNSLIWLTYKEQGNSQFEITLKSYQSILKTYNSFTFKVWINDELPVILSNILEGSTTKESITLNFNPGLIYNQVGKSYIEINGKVVMTIDETSQVVVETISILEKGTYWVKIISEDGSLISAYKYTKTEPLTGVTKFILIGAGIGVLVIIVMFVLLRKKGKYR